MAKMQGARAHHSTTQSRATNTALVFDTDDYDDNAFHDTSSNTSRMTIPAGAGGRYIASCQAATSGGAAGQYGLYFKVTGSTTNHSADFRDSATTADKKFHITEIFNLAAGDYVEVFVNHTGTITWASAIFTIQRIG